MEEIKRLQELAGILNEIKVNNPGIVFPLIINNEEEWNKKWPILLSNNFIWSDGDEIDDFLSDCHDYPITIIKSGEKEIQIDDDAMLGEDVSKFKVGQSTHSDGHKSTVTAVDPTTQSVTWNIKKEISDKEIWDDLTKLLNKFEAIHLKDFHSRPKLNSLIKDLKTLRNKFSRTIQK